MVRLSYVFVRSFEQPQDAMLVQLQPDTHLLFKLKESFINELLEFGFRAASSLHLRDRIVSVLNRGARQQPHDFHHLFEDGDFEIRIYFGALAGFRLAAAARYGRFCPSDWHYHAWIDDYFVFLAFAVKS